MDRLAGAASPSHDDLSAARCSPYAALSPEAVAAGEVGGAGEGQEMARG